MNVQKFSDSELLACCGGPDFERQHAIDKPLFMPYFKEPSSRPQINSEILAPSDFNSLSIIKYSYLFH
jgi:hypothetical protein